MGFFDWGRSLVNALPGVGGITTAIWGDPSQEGVQDAYKQSREEMAKQNAYQMMGRMNAMNQGALAFGPRNQMLGQMMGQTGPNAQAMDLTPMLQNPMSHAQQDAISQAAFGAPNQPQQPKVQPRNTDPYGRRMS